MNSRYLSSSHRWLLLGVLVFAMLGTRTHLISHLADASWAIFFLAGLYLSGWRVFAGLMALAIAIDLGVTAQSGGAPLCITGAYGFLIPAYAALFLGGRILASRWNGEVSVKSGLAFFGIAALAIAAAELISNGSFYWLGGFTQDASVSGMWATYLKYLPNALTNTGFYVLVAGGVHLLFHSLWAQRDTSTQEN